MNLAWFRFYEELNEFLPSRKRKCTFAYSFNGNPAVKDAIEAIGVPHTEIDLILVNSISVDFSYRLVNNDSVSVYPVFESFDISPVTHLRKKPLRKLKFILDVHLGKLAKYLRLSGFDTCYRNDYDDPEIIRLALTERRILLTHDLGLLKNRQVTHGYWIRSQYLREQLIEVFRRFDLKNHVRLFSRCMECNGKVIRVLKKEVAGRLLPMTNEFFDEFRRCSSCGRIYWNGSHYIRMKKYIESVINDVN
jgi:uncharacterized protein